MFPIRLLFITLLSLVSVATFAQNFQSVPSGNGGIYYWQTSPGPSVSQVVLVREIQPQLPFLYQRQMPQLWGQGGIQPGCQLVRADLWSRLANGAKEAFLDSLVGGLTGAVSDRINRTGGHWTNIGLHSGLAVGFLQGSREQYTVICPKVDDQKPVIGQGSCVVGGENFGNTSEETCLRIRKRLTKDSSSQKTYDGPPKVVNGHTCAVFDEKQRVIADFLDENRNPKGIRVTSGEKCQEERENFSNSFR